MKVSLIHLDLGRGIDFKLYWVVKAVRTELLEIEIPAGIKQHLGI